jgi:hypothetical protein
VLQLWEITFKQYNTLFSYFVCISPYTISPQNLNGVDRSCGMHGGHKRNADRVSVGKLRKVNAWKTQV